MIKLRLVLVSSISYVLYNDESYGFFLILDQTITHTSLTGVLDYSSVEVLNFKQFIYKVTTNPDIYSSEKPSFNCYLTIEFHTFFRFISVSNNLTNKEISVFDTRVRNVKPTPHVLQYFRLAFMDNCKG